MKIIVQKFGGTSVASEEARVAVKNKVQQAIRNGYSPVVVVSAMGRKGAPYAILIPRSVFSILRSISFSHFPDTFSHSSVIHPFVSVP